jgi:Heparinase II/III-like protein
MIDDSDDGYVLDLGDSREISALFCIGTGPFRRGDFRGLPGSCAGAAYRLLANSSRAGINAVASMPADELLVSRALPDSGYYPLQHGHKGGNDRISVMFDCGELGFKSFPAHGHANAPSYTLRAFGADVFVDPGTYGYVGFPAWRAYFRSTMANNALAVDGFDQSVMLGPFLWGSRAPARCLDWQSRIQGGRVTGEHDGYGRLADPVLHRRTVQFDERTRILSIEDDVVARRTLEIAVYFHLSEEVLLTEEHANHCAIAVGGGRVGLGVDRRLVVDVMTRRDEPIGGWVSRGYHRKVPSTTLIARGRCEGRSS